ncbi:serine hydrolase family protein [Erwinia endophytica]|uniref:RBBP9/YdeN family alpha/beta hydrolase n=1 Tax=Erwinia endophytica TaxID=1563158 RepID=UPI001265DEDF|nr:alpha/beta hydrolase [Erwinia endophytica]KAB8307569.1 serine hydrolase family protein [Erwinia endophytica]
MSSTRLVIVHGFMAAPTHHWFQWLKNEAETAGMQVLIPPMPDSDAPDLNKWLNALENTVGQSDENTWFIGHSLGCITILRYLTEKSATCKAAGMIMVSGFSEPVEGLALLHPFTQVEIAAERIINGVRHRAVLASLHDDIVPPEYSLRLSQQLDADFYAVPHAGHFLGRDGFHELPRVLALLNDFTERQQQ